MDQEQIDKFLSSLKEWLRERDDVLGADRIDGEDVVGFETSDGEEFFLELKSA